MRHSASLGTALPGSIRTYIRCCRRPLTLSSTSNNATMKLAAAAQINKGVMLTGERLVVVGGTQGIGEGIACRFAEAGAEVWIVGRNEAKAKTVLESLKAISAEQKIDPAPEHFFLKADLSLVSEAKRVARDIRTRAGSQGVEYLVMCQGGPPNGTFVLTSEGHEQHYAVQVLSRFIIAHELAGDPASSTVKKAVMSTMAPGVAKAMFSARSADDIDLSKANAQGKYGIFVAVARDSTVMDAATEDLAKGNPNVNFTHVFPGSVKTQFARNAELPWLMSMVTSMMLAVMGVSPRQYADIPFYLLAHPDGRTQAAREMFMDEKLGKVEPNAVIRDEEVRGKIRSHLLGIVSSK